MNDLLLKYNQLNHFSQRQLLDFLEFLLGKQKKEQNGLDLKNYRKKLLQVSIWSDIDEQEMNQNSKKLNWKLEEW